MSTTTTRIKRAFSPCVVYRIDEVNVQTIKKSILLTILSLSALFLLQCQYVKSIIKDLELSSAEEEENNRDTYSSNSESEKSSSSESKKSRKEVVNDIEDSSSSQEAEKSSSSETKKTRKEAK